MNLFENEGYQRLLRALLVCANNLGLKNSDWLRKQSRGNRNIIHARISPDGKIELSFSGSAGWGDNESLCIMFHLEPNLSEALALQRIEQALRVSNIEWLAFVNGLWILRTDVLRRQVSRVRNYRWLNGYPVVYPEFSHQPESWMGNPREQTVVAFETSENVIEQ